ncbi:hypothetical protein JCM16303_005118 [Sporobolomyces ruberrimus]
MGKISRLPVEILLEILEAASQSSNRNTSLIKLATVCRAFTAPALCLLFERLSLHTDQQARDYLREIEAAREPLSLATRTRRLSVTYRTNEDDTSTSPTSRPVQASTAIKVFYLLRNLTHLRLDSDDGLRALESAMRRRGEEDGVKSLVRKVRTVKLLGNVRWDTLVSLVEDSKHLRELHVAGLCQSQLDRGGRAPDNFELEPLATISDTEVDAVGTEDPSSVSDAPTTDAVPTCLPFKFPSSLDRPASPLPGPPRTIPAFPRFANLRLLRLEKPRMNEYHLFSMIAALRDSLESFALVEATLFSRQALVIVLRNLPNLFELDLTDCAFPDAIVIGGIDSDWEEDPFRPPPPRGLTFPDPPSALTDHLDPYASPFEISQAISGLELLRPLDCLPLYCPFLQSLKFTSPPTYPSLVSRLFFKSALPKLPLHYLTIGTTEARGIDHFGRTSQGPFEKELILDMILALRDRLEALAITKS